MDIHRSVAANIEIPQGRECDFCKQFDSEFSQRKQVDRLVGGNMADSAAAHFTEDGHVRHRLLELKNLLATSA